LQIPYIEPESEIETKLFLRATSCWSVLSRAILDVAAAVTFYLSAAIGPGVWKTSGLLLMCWVFSYLTCDLHAHLSGKEEKEFSAQLFIIWGVLAGGGGAQNTSVRQIHGCLFDISLRSCSAQILIWCERMRSVDTRRRSDSELFTRVTEVLNVERWWVKEPESSTVKFKNLCYW